LLHLGRLLEPAQHNGLRIAALGWLAQQQPAKLARRCQRATWRRPPGYPLA
jgi:hypothetical protein